MRESLVKLKKLYRTERIVNHCHYCEMKIRLFFMQNSCIQNKSLWSKLERMSESHCRFWLIICLQWSSFPFSCITAVMNSKEIWWMLVLSWSLLNQLLCSSVSSSGKRYCWGTSVCSFGRVVSRERLWVVKWK